MNTRIFTFALALLAVCHISAKNLQTSTMPPTCVNGVYQLSDSRELYWFAALVNGTLKDGTPQNKAAQAVLVADILLNDTTDWQNWNDKTKGLNRWTPIGNYTNSKTDFSGSFDGQGHTISGIYITTKKHFQGLFGSANDGTIQNLNIKASYIKGGDCVGCLAGTAGPNQTIRNCHSNATLEGRFQIGGIVGDNVGTITNCHNNGTVSGNRNSIGGIAGDNYGTIDQCCNTGTISGYFYVGGIAGITGIYVNHETKNEYEEYEIQRYASVITNCHNSGTINGVYDNIGGIAGENISIIEHCENTGFVSGGNRVGGIVGNASGYCPYQWSYEYEPYRADDYPSAITNCHNSGPVSGNNSIGGLAGYNFGTIAQCYNTSKISGANAVGGIAGFTSTGTAYIRGIEEEYEIASHIANCYNTGEVSCSGEDAGHIAGYFAGAVENCYYLSDSDSQHFADENAGNAAIQPKTAQAFASGHVCWLLNGQNSTDVAWNQELGTDTSPVLKTGNVVCNIRFVAKQDATELLSMYANEGRTCSLPTAEQLGLTTDTEVTFTDHNGTTLTDTFVANAGLEITVAY